MQLAIFGIDGGALSIAINLLVLFLVVCYLALIYWTYLDARRRIEDPVLIACAAAASLFPFVGTVVYTILRPPEFIEDRHERELELRAAELRLRQLIEQSCPYCEYPIERNYLRCPNCERRLRGPCRKCRKPLDPKWGVCPYCETEVRKQSGERRERARREERSGSPRARESGERSSGFSSGSRSSSGSGGSGRSSSRSGASGDRSDKPRRDPDRPSVRVQGRSEERSGGSGGSGSTRTSS